MITKNLYQEKGQETETLSVLEISITFFMAQAKTPLKKQKRLKITIIVKLIQESVKISWFDNNPKIQLGFHKTTI